MTAGRQISAQRCAGDQTKLKGLIQCPQTPAQGNKTPKHRHKHDEITNQYKHKLPRFSFTQCPASSCLACSWRRLANNANKLIDWLMSMGDKLAPTFCARHKSQHLTFKEAQ